MRYIDLRSDTVAQPTEEMRQAMLSAPGGDSMLEADPAVLRLEALAAQVTGKQAGLFLPSGTMANQVAVMAHTAPGDEIIIASGGYMVVHEVGAAAVLSGVTVNAIPCDEDMLTPALIEKHKHTAPGRKSMLCLENSLGNGLVMPLAQMQACYETAQALGMQVHLDGARLFNAATALMQPAAEICKYAHSVMFCLNKGLCAPMGSMLCGDEQFIERARVNRAILGGALRQPGMIAACGIIAIEKMSKRLDEDHHNAQTLAQGISQFPGLEIIYPVQTNMVFFTVDKPRSFLAKLPAQMLGKGIKVNGEEGGVLRFVTNNDVTAEDVQYVLRCFGEVLQGH
ncbi:threonine aldolase [Ruminococcaceae bacterium OttesenSCG-928-N02]|nr:threonine aldolase [Ruminococcaceae bacterium OttesenSCG-928-N02]